MKKNKKSSKEEYNFFYSKFCTKLLIFCIMFLSICIVSKKNINFRKVVYDKVYNSNISFVSLKKIYNKYLGGVVPLDKVVSSNDTEMVFNEEINFTSYSKYLDGIKVDVSDNYLVPVIEDGMVVFTGEKEGYGNVIIVEGLNGIDIWYANIVNSNVKLYDYLEKGSSLGEVNKELYLVFCKNGKYISYEEYNGGI